jgi:hypothetical protein
VKPRSGYDLLRSLLYGSTADRPWLFKVSGRSLSPYDFEKSPPWKMLEWSIHNSE